MRLTQGAFSFLPDLTDEQIVKQIQYAISRGWALNVEWTDDPHPRNSRSVESCCLSFIVQRPTSNEPGFTLARTEDKSRFIRYTIQSYATSKPEGERY